MLSMGAIQMVAILFFVPYMEVAVTAMFTVTDMDRTVTRMLPRAM